MSKSYRKKYLRLSIGTGTNTSYYRAKRRTFRRKTRQQLHIKLEDFVHPEKLKVFKDTWDEPTDGSWLVTSEKIKDNYAANGWEGWIKLLHKLKKYEKRHIK